MANSLMHLSALAQLGCDVLNQTDPSGVRQAVQGRLLTAHQQMSQAGPQDQLWKKTEELFQSCVPENTSAYTLEEYARFYKNLYRFTITAAEITRFLMHWENMDAHRSEGSIFPSPDIVHSREVQSWDFPKDAADSPLKVIGEETAARLRSHGIGDTIATESWTHEEYRRHFLRNIHLHRRTVVPEAEPEHPCGFYSWKTEKPASAKTQTPQRHVVPKIIERMVAKKPIATSVLPDTRIIPQRIGYREAHNHQVIHHRVHVTRKEMALHIAFCMMDAAREQNAYVTLPDAYEKQK